MGLSFPEPAERAATAQGPGGRGSAPAGNIFPQRLGKMTSLFRRSGGGGGGGGSEAPPLRPPAVHQRGCPDILRMVNTGHYALVNRLRAAERLVLSIFSLALAFNLVSSGVCRGEDFISIG